MKGNFKNQWEQAKRDSELEYRKKHINKKQGKEKYRNTKTHRIVLIFTYVVTIPFLGIVIGGNIGWFVAGIIGFLGLFAVLKK